jgi:hypothetical protein
MSKFNLSKAVRDLEKMNFFFEIGNTSDDETKKYIITIARNRESFLIFENITQGIGETLEEAFFEVYQELHIKMVETSKALSEFL